MKQKSINIKSSLLIAMTMLSGCGGSDGENNNTTSQVITGRYLDANVQGLNYSTATQSGTTNANGEFEYEAGENVVFSLYGQELSTVPGYPVITPLDNISDTLHADYAINLMRFMQTLDTDGVSGNGITLPDTASGVMNVNFNQSMVSFESDSNVLSFISQNTNVSALSVTASDAVTHFQSTIDSITDDYVLQLSGKTATSVITAEYCSNNPQGGFTYSFNDTGFTMSGTDSFNSTQDGTGVVTCTLGSAATETFLWTDVSAENSFAFYCGSNCTYNQLNRVESGVDLDGRAHISSVWHTPNTDKVYSIKRITNDPTFTLDVGDYAFTEVFTIN